MAEAASPRDQARPKAIRAEAAAEALPTGLRAEAAAAPMDRGRPNRGQAAAVVEAAAVAPMDRGRPNPGRAAAVAAVRVGAAVVAAGEAVVPRPARVQGPGRGRRGLTQC